jgi:hypothetical protein
MLTYTNFGKSISGNLGNNLFQLAALIGLSKRYKTEACIPTKWKYEQYFKLTHIQIKDTTPTQCIREPFFHYCIDSFDECKNEFELETIDLLGWFQSKKYWEDYESEIRASLQFKPDLVDSIFSHQNIIDSSYVAVSVRRGDYETNPNFELLSKDYYLGALKKHFDGFKIVIFSDDFIWCKNNLIGISNISFAETLSPIQQLCLMSKFENFVIANSTFSWWGAYLSSVNSKVIRPNYHFAGEKLKKHILKDYYPQNWLVFDHKIFIGKK